MDRALYRKAKDLVDKGRVTIEDETEKRVYLIVEGAKDTYKVRLESDHTYSCTCPYATLRGLAKGAVCSHILAAMLFVASELDKE